MSFDAYSKLKLLNIAIHWIFKVSFMVFLLTTECETAYSQSCAPLSPVENDQIAYGRRGNRCEGYYQANVNKTHDLKIVGVVEGAFNFALKENEVIEISSSFIKNQPIKVRASGIPIKAYYRMDAEIAANQKLRWPTRDIIYQQKLSASDIGVFGWIGTEAKKTYVPVRIAAKIGYVVNDEKIRLYLRASDDVTSVLWRFSEEVTGGCTPFSGWIDTDKSYGTAVPIIITLPQASEQKLCFEVAAKEKWSPNWLKAKGTVVVNHAKEN